LSGCAGVSACCVGGDSEIELGKVYAVGTEPVALGDGVEAETVCVVGVVAVVAEEEDVFLVAAATDDAPPSRLVE
jgi:hypothetical protein